MAEQDSPDGAVKPKSKLKFVLLPLALLAMVGGGALTATQYTAVAGVVHRVGGPAGEAAEAKPIEYGVFAQIEGLTINPVSQGPTRYLLTSIGIEAPKEVVLEEVSERDIVVRDTIIKLLSARTVEELSSVEGRHVLKEDVRGAINSVLRKGEISRVYFTQYVVQ